MNNLKTKIVVISFFVLALMFTACDERDAYHEFRSVKEGSWSRNDTLLFSIDTLSFVAGQPYDIRIETVNNSRYGYQNLWLFVRSNIESDSVCRQDTLQLQLADAFGKWKGSGFSSAYQVDTLYRQRVVFPKKKKYRIQVIQGMREEPLLGIDRVGLRLTRSR